MAKKLTAAKFYKLGKKASIFVDPSTQLKVTKNKPGRLEDPPNPSIVEASSKGHIIEIDEDQYDDMMAQHDVNVENNNKRTAMQKKIKKGEAVDADLVKLDKKIKSDAEVEVEDEDDEEVEEKEEEIEDEDENTESDDSDSDDDDDTDSDDEDEEEEEKPKKKAKKKASRKKKK